MFFIAYTFKGQVHVFAGWVKIVTRPAGQVQYWNIFVPCYGLAIELQDAGTNQQIYTLAIMSISFFNFHLFFNWNVHII